MIWDLHCHLAGLAGRTPGERIARLIEVADRMGVERLVALRCNDPRLDALIRRAAELKALIFQHTWFKSGGNLPGESTPHDLAELARRHPDVPLVCGHTGGNWELGIRAVRDCPNVYLDTAGSDPTSGFVEMAVREVGAQRVLYGSDVPGRSFASQLAKVMGADVTPADRQQILQGNLRRLLFPILRAKGVRL